MKIGIYLDENDAVETIINTLEFHISFHSTDKEAANHCAYLLSDAVCATMKTRSRSNRERVFWEKVREKLRKKVVN